MSAELVALPTRTPAHPDVRWAALYVGAIATFVTSEVLAIRSDRDGRTFTSQSRFILGHVPGPARWALRVAILGLTAWAGAHLAEGLQ